MIAYRPDIDGLRAVSVLAVIFFHLEIAHVKGGFVGVDVFFVISGFLITSIILKDLKNGSFSIGRFYERRIRRILPALFVVLFATTFAAFFILLPPQFVDFGKALASTVGFGSNILFWDMAGYFEPESDLRPLLHTWSLGVEEQFYILYPLGLILIARFQKSYITPLIVLGLVVSFLIGVWGIENEKIAATFYLLPPRAWELLLGAVLATGIVPTSKNRMLNNIMGAAGLSLIVSAALFYNDKITFPGPNALLPTLGAALLIYTASNQQTWAARLLSLKPFVFTGRISYSLYLWHWPLVAFYAYASPWPLSWISQSLILIASFVLSVLTWFYIEDPIHKQNKLSRRSVFTGTLVSGAILLMISGLIVYSEGYDGRFPESVQKYAKSKIGMRLPKLKHDDFKAGTALSLGALDQPASFIVWGDSHAFAVAPAFHEYAMEEGIHGYLLRNDGCMPSVGEWKNFEESCWHFNKSVQEFIASHPDIEAVVLIARWASYNKRLIKKGEQLPGQKKEETPIYVTLDSVLQFLTSQKKKAFFVVEPPQAPVDRWPLYLARAEYYGQTVDVKTSFLEYKKTQIGVYKALEDLRDQYDFEVIQIHEPLCNNRDCITVHDGYSLYYDDDHLSKQGALFVQSVFAPVFDWSKTDP